MFDPASPAAAYTPSPAPFTEDMFQAKKPKRNNKKTFGLVGGGVGVLAVVGVVLALTLPGKSPAPAPGPTTTGSRTTDAAVKACPADSSGGLSAAARWTLRGTSGDCAEAPSRTHALTLAGGADFATSDTRGQVLRVDGNDAVATVSNSGILNTSSSFTVSIWVYYTTFDRTAYSTALAFHGQVLDSFAIEYNPGSGGWTFNHTTEDSAGAKFASAASKTEPKARTWTHLVGVFNAQAKTLALYVDGKQVAERAGVAAWNAKNEITLGADVNQSGSTAAAMQGELSDLQLFDSAMTAQQVADLK
jgi:hypothetical protein